MRRGEIRLVNLDPIRGAEANKPRPAVIVSNDGANSTAQRLGRGVVTVVPATSNTERVYLSMAIGFSPVAVTRIPHWRPSEFPTGGHRVHPVWLSQRRHPLP